MRSIVIWGLLLIVGVYACNNTKKKTSLEGQNRDFGKNKSEKKPENGLILEKTVGNFSLGAPIPKSSGPVQVEKSKQTRFTEGGVTEEIIYMVSENGKQQMILKPEFDLKTEKYNDSIGEIIILSEKYKTEEDIGVGSSLEEFKEAYPGFKIWYTYVSDRYVLENSQLNAQFLLSEADFIGEITVNSVQEPLQASDFETGAKIQKIRLYE